MDLASLRGSDAASYHSRWKIPPCLVTAQSMGDWHKSANEKSLYFKISVSSDGFYVYNSPSEVHKRALSALVSLDLHVVRH